MVYIPPLPDTLPPNTMSDLTVYIIIGAIILFFIIMRIRKWKKGDDWYGL